MILKLVQNAPILKIRTSAWTSFRISYRVSCTVCTLIGPRRYDGIVITYMSTRASPKNMFSFI